MWDPGGDTTVTESLWERWHLRQDYIRQEMLWGQGPQFPAWRTEKMAFIAVLGLLMTGICPAVLCCSDGTLGSHTAVQKGQDTQNQLDSLTLASINEGFAFSLYKLLNLKNLHKNIVFSPLSLAIALASVSLGAKGTTLEEILEGLKFNVTETPEADIHRGFGQLLQKLSQSGDQVQISTGSAIFPEKHLQILTEFKEKARALYQTEAFPANFQQPCEAREFINDHVMKETQGKIKELVSDLVKRTSMVAVNYLLFRGKWKVPFDPDDTFMGKFILDRMRPVMVPMMKIEYLTIPYFRDEELKCTVVELSYTDNGKAIFILPDQGKMQQVEASLQPETMRKWRKSLRPRMIDELCLPKFSVSKNYRLESIFPELGIKELFSTQAGLSGITGDKGIRVSLGGPQGCAGCA
ncbi:Serine (or cysteine) peptidase inhibitor, clade A (alpha-1 antiproteinase, antitrypsin), member 3J [Apodemus speciosus]|uniref:Serine (Or cysteine) peptidase inhibitor, clade A (Alpha-1 antiproteinase, antitrypsin), member 3J n=1 Tax=Apodemus speciosus TaxID=105296 RepID=A0ABQ0FEU3_APOSI